MSPSLPERARRDGAVGSTASPPSTISFTIPSWPMTKLARFATPDHRHGAGVLLRHLAARVGEERVGELQLGLELLLRLDVVGRDADHLRALLSTSAYWSRKFEFCFVQPE